MIQLVLWGSWLASALTGLLLWHGALAVLGWRWQPGRRWSALLVQNGKLLSANLRALGMSKLEIISAIRQAGIRSLDEVHSVSREPDGSLAVKPRLDRRYCRSILV